MPIYVTTFIWCAAAALGILSGSSFAREVSAAFKYGSENVRVISGIGAVIAGLLSLIAAIANFSVTNSQPQVAFDHWVVCMGWVFLSSMIVPIVLIVCQLAVSIYTTLTSVLRTRAN